MTNSLSLSLSRNSALLDDLDDMFTAELASIDNFLESKQSEEKKAEERRKKESIDVKMREKKAMEVIKIIIIIIIINLCICRHQIFLD